MLSIEKLKPKNNISEEKDFPFTFGSVEKATFQASRDLWIIL